MVLTKVGLTGASGMLGRHVLQLLHKRRLACSATSLTKPSSLTAEDSWSAWDLRIWKEPDDLDGLFADVGAVIHAGALVPKAPGQALSSKDLFDANVRASTCLAAWASRRNIPIVYISGAVVYSSSCPRPREDDPLDHTGARNFYCATKIWAEDILRHFVHAGLRCCILRPSSIYGFGLPEDKLISRFLRAASRGETILLTPPADDQVNCVHASDVAEAALRAIERERWSTYNVGSGPYQLRAIAETCIRVAGRGSVRVADGNPGRGPMVQLDINCSKAQSQLGIMPLDFEAGLEAMWKDQHRR